MRNGAAEVKRTDLILIRQAELAKSMAVETIYASHFFRTVLRNGTYVKEHKLSTAARVIFPMLLIRAAPKICRSI